MTISSEGKRGNMATYFRQKYHIRPSSWLCAMIPENGNPIRAMILSSPHNNYVKTTPSVISPNCLEKQIILVFWTHQFVVHVVTAKWQVFLYMITKDCFCALYNAHQQLINWYHTPCQYNTTFIHPSVSCIQALCTS